MEYCNKKMNLRGTLRCEEELGHTGACAVQVTKAPKKNGKLMRAVIIAGDSVKKTKPVSKCVYYVHKEGKDERINFILDCADASGEFTIEQLTELNKLGAYDRAISLLNAMQHNA